MSKRFTIFESNNAEKIEEIISIKEWLWKLGLVKTWYSINNDLIIKDSIKAIILLFEINLYVEKMMILRGIYLEISFQ